ncbi:MAG: pyridoxal phosphate-dependent aminotransferase [Candidatus Micrarchaeota archaeon]|nr:pyridoxal phosphate-dependent aminotransferase [Candidatus Micrarchaeota archaeon]
MDVSKRTLGLGTENAFVVLAEVNALKREGKDLISFCIGQPDFDTPQNIKDAAKKAIDAGKTGYTDSAGVFEVRAAIAKHLSVTRKIDVKPEHVVIANGAKPFIAYAIACTTDYGVGDEVIYPNPGFPIYESQIIASGAVPVPLPLTEKKKFSFEIDELKNRISNRTKMLIINTPHNPTGGILEEDDLREVAALAKKHDFWVYADEIYCRIAYDKEFKSIASLPGMYERTIISDGASKAYAMTGWRMGYIANQFLAPYVARWVTNTESCANHMAQYAMMEAVSGPQDESKKMVQSFRERRELIVKLLNELDGVKCLMPGGAFYAYPNVTDAVKRLGLKDSEELRKLLLKNGVAVLADIHFGKRNPGETEQYIRLSYATSKDNIIEGLRRMKTVIGSKDTETGTLSF